MYLGDGKTLRGGVTGGRGISLVAGALLLTQRDPDGTCLAKEEENVRREAMIGLTGR